MIEFPRYKMNRAAMHFDTRGERAFVRVQARKSRQERGMDVEKAVGVARDEPRREDAHEPGEGDPFGRMLRDLSGQRRIETLAGAVLLIPDDRSRHAAGCGDRETRSLRPVADYGRNRQAGVEDRLHIAAAAGDEDDE